jgi:hypothetical protein
MSQNVLDMAGVILPEPTNEPKLFWIWLACSYLSQPMSQNVLDMACMILPEPTNEPNGWDFWLTAIHDCQSLLSNYFLSASIILGIKMFYRKSLIFFKRKQGSFLT